MATNLSGQPIQAFQSRSTGEITYIPAMTDTVTGQHFVLWDDIQEGFENAKTIKNGEILVPFMKDERFKRIEPLRIPYHPGTVLSVIEGSASSVAHSRDVTRIITDTDTSKGSSSHSSEGSSHSTHEQDVVNLSVATIEDDSQPLVMYTRGIPEESQPALPAYNQLFNNYLEVITTGQQMQADTIMQSMDVHFDRLQTEMDENKALQDELVKVQQQMQEIQLKAREEQQQAQLELLEEQRQVRQLQKSMDEKQDRIINMQQQALNRLAIIQNRLQALLIQNYELHEYPIPRLFIVLPKATGLYDRLRKPFADQFRLYFLCECGTHTMPENCKTPHEIHLAKHDGYDLEQPTKFFEQYGSYLLAMMYMIKYGIVAAGLVVPPLARLDVADAVISGQKDVECVKKTIAPLVDDTIKYLQRFKQDMDAGAELPTDHTEFDKLEALEGADLRQLESYLKIKDKGRVLGNLYRIVTHEGHVKWVCFDHYRANYQEAVMQRLRDVVEVNNGKLAKEIGKIEIKIATHVLAREFYDVLVKARGIQELDITLEWDAAMDELRALSRAVTMANVIRLTVNGTHQLKGPTLDFINRNRRFDPIAQLASNARVQSLHLKGFDDFFSRVSSSSLAPTSKFRTFSMDSSFPSKDKSIKSFNSFLDHCVSLTTLELKLQGKHSIAKHLDDILRKLHKLETLKVDRENISFTTLVVDNTLRDTSLTIKRLSDLGSDDFKFIQQCGLTKLDIEYTPRKEDDGQLVSIIHCCPRLSTLGIGCVERRYLAVLELVVSARTSRYQEPGSCQLQTFRLMEEKLEPFDGYGGYSDSTMIRSCVSFAHDSPTFDMRSYVRLRVNMAITKREPIYTFARKYGWSIVYLQTQGPISDHFLEALDNITSERGSKFERLDAAPFWITDIGRDHLHRIIERASSSMGLYLSMEFMNDASRFERAEMFLSQFGDKVHGLGFHGDSPEEWLMEIVSSFPTRESFPNLTRFGIVHQEKSIRIPSFCVQWIVQMIPAPPPDLASALPSYRIQESGSPSVELARITHLDLWYVILLPEEWRMVIEAIDFSALQQLDLTGSNFGEDQFKLLIDRVPDNATEMVPLRVLLLGDTDLVRVTSSAALLSVALGNMDLVKTTISRALKALSASLREKIPLVDIRSE
ncbi:hypothetical protein B0O80DRAFT_502515 [Mortierella sp. GBAus27b]|nr:hypothetical protein BGX31_009262 [Mortierella sp. GBA43]KAI8347704.1 hypothetical protein B0O80DRAFT_502515 [Mortierella sp. GBAus27b]